jgi:hypothetical protein
MTQSTPTHHSLTRPTSDGARTHGHRPFILWPTELGHDPTPNLFTRAVNELVTPLRVSPFTISNDTDPLLHTLRERY